MVVSVDPLLMVVPLIFVVVVWVPPTTLPTFNVTPLILLFTVVANPESTVVPTRWTVFPLIIVLAVWVPPDSLPMLSVVPLIFLIVVVKDPKLTVFPTILLVLVVVPVVMVFPMGSNVANTISPPITLLMIWNFDFTCIAQEKEKQEKYIAEQQRLAKEAEEAERARQTEDQLKQLRELRHQQHQKATEVAGSKKFGSTDELISAYEEMNQVANGSSSEITPDVLRTYNKVRQAFGVHHVNRVANMGLVKQFLAENRKLYNDIKMKHQPPTSTVPSTRFGKGTIVQGAELLSNRSQPKKIIIEEEGGGGAKQSKKERK